MKKKEIKYTKAEILRSKNIDIDVAVAALKEGKTYSIEEANKAIEEFLNSKGVK